MKTKVTKWISVLTQCDFHTLHLSVIAVEKVNHPIDINTHQLAWSDPIVSPLLLRFPAFHRTHRRSSTISPRLFDMSKQAKGSTLQLLNESLLKEQSTRSTLESRIQELENKASPPTRPPPHPAYSVKSTRHECTCSLPSPPHQSLYHAAVPSAPLVAPLPWIDIEATVTATINPLRSDLRQHSSTQPMAQSPPSVPAYTTMSMASTPRYLQMTKEEHQRYVQEASYATGVGIFNSLMS